MQLGLSPPHTSGHTVKIVARARCAAPASSTDDSFSIVWRVRDYELDQFNAANYASAHLAVAFAILLLWLARSTS